MSELLRPCCKAGDFLFFRVSDIAVDSQQKLVVTSLQGVIHSGLNALHLTSEQIVWLGCGHN